MWVDTFESGNGIVKYARVSKNGNMGMVNIVRFGDKYKIKTYSNSSRKDWKTPDKEYKSLADAVLVAELLYNI